MTSRPPRPAQQAAAVAVGMPTGTRHPRGMEPAQVYEWRCCATKRCSSAMRTRHAPPPFGPYPPPARLPAQMVRAASRERSSATD